MEWWVQQEQHKNPRHARCMTSSRFTSQETVVSLRKTVVATSTCCVLCCAVARLCTIFCRTSASPEKLCGSTVPQGPARQVLGTYPPPFRALMPTLFYETAASVAVLG
jgi:hypothetical protein